MEYNLDEIMTNSEVIENEKLSKNIRFEYNVERFLCIFGVISIIMAPILSIIMSIPLGIYSFSVGFFAFYSGRKKIKPIRREDVVFLCCCSEIKEIYIAKNEYFMELSNGIKLRISRAQYKRFSANIPNRIRVIFYKVFDEIIKFELEGIY